MVSTQQHRAVLDLDRNEAQGEDVLAGTGVALQGGVPQGAVFVQAALLQLGLDLQVKACTSEGFHSWHSHSNDSSVSGDQ